jgi:hypothetical protein
MGYNSLTGEVTGIRCFDGFGDKYELTKGGTANLEVLADVDRARLKRIMEGEVELKIPVYPGIRAVGTAAYASEYAKTDYSQNFVVNLRAVTERSRLVLPDDLANIKPSAVLQRINGVEEGLRPQLMNEACGDEYVAYWEKGLSFSAVLSVQYSNELDLKRFSGTLSAEILSLSIPVELRAEYERMKSSAQARASLVVQQLGGKPTELLQKLLGPDAGGDKTRFFLQCDSESLDDCVDVFKKVMAYLKNVETQFRDDQGRELGSGVPLIVESLPYPNQGGFQVLYGSDVLEAEPMAVEEKKESVEMMRTVREDLDKELGNALADRGRILDLDRRLGLKVDANFKQKIAETKAKADAYINDLKVISDECRIKKFDKEKIKYCFNRIKDLAKNKPYDNSVLKNDAKTFREWCELASSTTNILNDGDWVTVLALNSIADPMGTASCEANEKTLLARNELNLSSDKTSFGISSLAPLGSLGAALQKVVANNQIIGTANGLENLSNLQSLDLADNQVTSLQSFTSIKFQGARSLNLRNNLIETLDSGSGSLDVSMLDVTGNRISKMKDFKSSLLFQLILDNNPIKIDGFEISSIKVPPTSQFQLINTGTTTCPFPEAARCRFQ